MKEGFVLSTYRGYTYVPNKAAPTPTPGRKPKRRKHRIFGYIAIMMLLTSLGGVLWFYFTESGTNLRYTLADTLITTQHRDYAKYLIGQDQLNRRVDDYLKKFDAMGLEKDNHNIQISPLDRKSVV